MDAIAFQKVTKSLGGFRLQDFNLTVPAGTICGLVGENGAGKTTSIRLLMGALHPDSGSISVLGTEVGTPAFTAAKNDIGVVLDDGCLPSLLTAAQIGNVFSHIYSNWDAAVYDSYLTRLEIPRDKACSQFSRGMKMKLSIAVALSHHAKLLVLDEATAGLDPIVRDEIVELFREFVSDEEHSILISSHIISDLEKLCDYIAFVHQGRLLFCREKDLLLEEHGIFVGTAEQAESLLPEAVVGTDRSGYGGIRALVKRNLVPPTLELERPTMEDIILYTVKGGKNA